MEHKSKNRLKWERNLELISIKQDLESLPEYCKDLGVFVYKSLANIPTDVRMLRTESFQLSYKMYSYARKIELSGTKDEKELFIRKFKSKLEDLRSTFRIIIELKLFNGEFAFQTLKKFSEVDKKFTNISK